MDRESNLPLHLRSKSNQEMMGRAAQAGHNWTSLSTDTQQSHSGLTLMHQIHMNSHAKQQANQDFNSSAKQDHAYISSAIEYRAQETDPDVLATRSRLSQQLARQRHLCQDRADKMGQRRPHTALSMRLNEGMSDPFVQVQHSTSHSVQRPGSSKSMRTRSPFVENSTGTETGSMMRAGSFAADHVGPKVKRQTSQSSSIGPERKHLPPTSREAQLLHRKTSLSNELDFNHRGHLGTPEEIEANFRVASRIQTHQQYNAAHRQKSRDFLPPHLRVEVERLECQQALEQARALQKPQPTIRIQRFPSHRHVSPECQAEREAERKDSATRLLPIPNPNELPTRKPPRYRRTFDSDTRMSIPVVFMSMSMPGQGPLSQHGESQQQLQAPQRAVPVVQPIADNAMDRYCPMRRSMSSSRGNPSELRSRSYPGLVAIACSPNIDPVNAPVPKARGLYDSNGDDRWASVARHFKDQPVFHSSQDDTQPDCAAAESDTKRGCLGAVEGTSSAVKTLPLRGTTEQTTEVALDHGKPKQFLRRTNPIAFPETSHAKDFLEGRHQGSHAIVPDDIKRGSMCIHATEAINTQKYPSPISQRKDDLMASSGLHGVLEDGPQGSRTPSSYCGSLSESKASASHPSSTRKKLVSASNAFCHRWDQAKGKLRRGPPSSPQLSPTKPAAGLPKLQSAHGSPNRTYGTRDSDTSASRQIAGDVPGGLTEEAEDRTSRLDSTETEVDFKIVHGSGMEHAHPSPTKFHTSGAARRLEESASALEGELHDHRSGTLNRGSSIASPLETFELEATELRAEHVTVQPLQPRPLSFQLQQTSPGHLHDGGSTTSMLHPSLTIHRLYAMVSDDLLSWQSNVQADPGGHDQNKVEKLQHHLEDLSRGYDCHPSLLPGFEELPSQRSARSSRDSQRMQQLIALDAGGPAVNHALVQLREFADHLGETDSRTVPQGGGCQRSGAVDDLLDTNKGQYTVQHCMTIGDGNEANVEDVDDFVINTIMKNIPGAW